MSLIELKKICEEKLNEVNTLYTRISDKLINQDLEQYKTDSKHKIEKINKGYVFDDNVFVTVKNGMLDIEDRRAEAFGWTFEIISDMSCGDIFEHDGKIYSVKTTYDENLSNEVERVIKNLENMITQLRRGNIGTRKYYSAHEDITVDTFEQVIDTVYSRKI